MLVRTCLITTDHTLRERLAGLVENEASVVERTPSEGDFWQRLGRAGGDLILVERGLLEDPVEGVVAQARDLPDHPEIIALVGEDGAQERARLLAAGCLAVIWTGLADDVLRDTLATLIARRAETATTRLAAQDADEHFRLGDFVSHSPAMQRFLQIANKVAATDSTVLILGETGVGKERLARALHLEGRRGDGPFVVVNCAAVPESLWESELFGHEAGAFTGAERSRRGYVELAHGGTLFLDEIGDMPLHLQVKLLRVLQEKQIQRVGAERSIDVDVRVIAATNRDLVADMEAERFRSDLYYRLSVVTMTIPPLRERREDIRSLAENYRRELAEQINRHVLSISPEAMDALLDYSWPGNIRELVNVIERAVILADDAITLDDLPEPLADQPHHVATNASSGEIDAHLLSMSLAEAKRMWADSFEKAYLTRLLEETGGKIGLTASRAGIDPRSLYTKMRQYGLRKEDFRREAEKDRAGDAGPVPG